LYVKAGQAIGIQVGILPKPYHALAQMFDGAEPISLEAVRKVIHEELGMWPEEIFAEFDPVPLGSAVSETGLYFVMRDSRLPSVEYCASPSSQAPYGGAGRSESTKT